MYEILRTLGDDPRVWWKWYVCLGNQLERHFRGVPWVLLEKRADFLEPTHGVFFVDSGSAGLPHQTPHV